MLTKPNHLKERSSQVENLSIHGGVWQLFETMGHGVVCESADGRVVTVNKSAECILGLSSKEMQDRKLTDSPWKIVREDGSIFSDVQLPSKTALQTAKTIDTQNGRISIITHIGENKILIKIQDTGQGIPEAIQQRIFDPCFTTKAIGKGTSHRLSMAHNTIITKHHGNIMVDSIEGQGTTSAIELPLDSLR